eukprot:1739273-Pleurochrysis_carterae.AAC.1
MSLSEHAIPSRTSSMTRACRHHQSGCHPIQQQACLPFAICRLVCLLQLQAASFKAATKATCKTSGRIDFAQLHLTLVLRQMALARRWKRRQQLMQTLRCSPRRRAASGTAHAPGGRGQQEAPGVWGKRTAPGNEGEKRTAPGGRDGTRRPAASQRRRAALGGARWRSAPGGKRGLHSAPRGEREPRGSAPPGCERGRRSTPGCERGRTAQ